MNPPFGPTRTQHEHRAPPGRRKKHPVGRYRSALAMMNFPSFKAQGSCDSRHLNES